MGLQHKVGQIRNLFRKLPEKGKALDWVFIYGLPRSGTTYVLNQFLKVARCGIGDWELDEYFSFIRQTRERDYVTLDTERAMAEMRENILDSAHVGGGQSLDIVVKQIDSSPGEYRMLCELFGSEARSKLFLFREPSSWLPSAMEKFGIESSKAVKLYQSAVKGSEHIGGSMLEYGEGLDRELKALPYLEEVTPDPFEIRRPDSSEPPQELLELYKELQERKEGEKAENNGSTKSG